MSTPRPSRPRHQPPALAPAVLLVLIPLLAAAAPELAASWESVRNWSVQPVCVPIPQNMSLCRDIGYSQMRLPNLLQHESMAEVVQQSATWVSLLNLRCHPDTQLFLCSLYAPICLESEILPCRSLCQNVERGCAGRMAEYGYPWPDIVRCDKFAEDNDMCIKPQADRKATTVEEPKKAECEVCEQPETKESIMDHFCRADVVLVSKFRRLRPQRAQLGKGRLFKPQSAPKEQRRALRRPRLAWSHDSSCCPAVKERAGKYLVMARRNQGGQLVPTLVMPWKRDRLFRSVRGLMRRFDCSDSRTIQEQILPSTVRGGGKRGRSKSGRRRRPKRPRRRQGGRRRGSRGRKQGARRRGRGKNQATTTVPPATA
ncbi:Secreted frizzled-related protein 5 [Amphibalanus amphitrite]|uniref:Secreted frizzled-related protein 5 n=1 Tax=Amphibalanus amphitrite TaxID=1232801 RepID=A0A6A4WV21_AMPAM|nr:Secreted frizzled-related protein 5 [Amphibalanus amphitrite]